MELNAKIAQLEEEINVLKGEIKTILLEVRTAVLARENPFAAAVLEAMPPPAAIPQVAPPAPIPAPVPEPIAPVAVAPLPPVEMPSARVEAPRPTLAAPYEDTPASKRLQIAEARRHWSVQTLASLMAWTQETAERFSSPDLGIVLSLARYGGLIEGELESTLTKVSRTLVRPEDQKRASVSDFLLALHQLNALLREENGDKSNNHPARLVS